MGEAGVLFSHTLLVLKYFTTFKDVQMMLKIFFDISTGFRFSKSSVKCSVHSCSCPWLDALVRVLLLFGLWYIVPSHYKLREVVKKVGVDSVFSVIVQDHLFLMSAASLIGP